MFDLSLIVAVTLVLAGAVTGLILGIFVERLRWTQLIADGTLSRPLARYASRR